VPNNTLESGFLRTQTDVIAQLVKKLNVASISIVSIGELATISIGSLLTNIP
jgi:hypothetical protein